MFLYSYLLFSREEKRRKLIAKVLIIFLYKYQIRSSFLVALYSFSATFLVDLCPEICI